MAGSSSSASPVSAPKDSDADMPDETDTPVDELWYTLKPFHLSPGTKIETYAARKVIWTMLNFKQDGSLEFADSSKSADATVHLVELSDFRCVQVELKFHDSTPPRLIAMTRPKFELRPGPELGGLPTLLLPEDRPTLLCQERHRNGRLDEFGANLTGPWRSACTYRPFFQQHSIGVDSVIAFENESEQRMFAQRVQGLYLSQVEARDVPMSAVTWVRLGALMGAGITWGRGAETDILQTIDPRGTHYDLHWRAKKAQARKEALQAKRDERPPPTEQRAVRVRKTPARS